MALPRVLIAAIPAVLAAIGATALADSWAVLAAAVVVLLAMTALVIWSVAAAMRPPRYPRAAEPEATSVRQPATLRRRAA